MSMYPIATGIASGSQILFTNIPQTFTHLQLRVFARSTVSSLQDFIFIRPNAESGNTLVSHSLLGDGGTASSSYISARSYAWLTNVPGATNTANVYGTAIIDILDYANTNKNKTIRGIGGYDVNGSGNVELVSSVWMSTSAITQIVCDTANNFAATGTRVDLYGISTSNATGA